MKHVSTKLKNKRGVLYNTRSNKTANGWSKHIAGNLNSKFLRLAVVGTFDTLGRTVRFDVIRVRLKHPTEFGYTKETYILKKNKDKFLDRIVTFN
jgi:hypothetical protein